MAVDFDYRQNRDEVAMPAGPRVTINAAMLAWARQQVEMDVDTLARRSGTRPAKVEGWEDGTEKPTLNQLRKAAEALGRTPAFFFLGAVPESQVFSHPHDYRSTPDAPVVPVLREVQRAEHRRRAFVDLVDTTPLNWAQSQWEANESPEQAAARIRSVLGVELAAQLAWRTDYEAIRGWSRAAERSGVLVFHFSRVPRSTQGVSIYHDVWPLVLLNGADTPNVRVFTLAHELGHLAMRSSGICDDNGTSGVEARCNRFAGALLMPRDAFLRELGDADPAASVARLAGRFRVSQSAAAVRLRTLDRISQSALDAMLATARRIASEQEERAAARNASTSGFVPQHILKARNLGPTFVEVVLEALDDSRIRYTDAVDLFGAKISTIEKVRDVVARGGASLESVLA